MQSGSAGRFSLNILFIGKYALERAAGDAVSVRRLTEQLATWGASAHYRPIDERGAVVGDLPEGIDLVHALNAEGPARAAISISRSLLVPLVVTTTGTDLDRGAFDLERRDALIENLERADHVIVLSDRQRSIVKSLVPGAAVTKVTQGVTLEPSSFDLRCSAGIANDRPIALMLGGLRPVKGHPFALDAWETCRPEAVLVIAGDRIDEGYAEHLAERASRAEDVILMRAISHADVMAAIAASDVLLNASESEGESRALLEAMTVGTPIVARNNDGNRTLLEGGAGLLFDDAQGLCDAIQRLLDDSTLRSAVVQRALETTRRRGEERSDAEVLVDVYRALAGRSRKQPLH